MIEILAGLGSGMGFLINPAPPWGRGDKGEGLIGTNSAGTFTYVCFLLGSLFWGDSKGSPVVRLLFLCEMTCVISGLPFATRIRVFGRGIGAEDERWVSENTSTVKESCTSDIEGSSTGVRESVSEDVTESCLAYPVSSEEEEEPSIP